MLLKTCINLLTPPQIKYSCPSVPLRDWLQDLLQIPSFMDARVPYIKLCRTMHIVGLSWIPRHRLKYCFWSAVGQIWRCEIQWYRGLIIYLLEKNMHVSGSAKFKPILFKCQLYIWGDLLQELVHAVRETKKSHNLLSASWKTRKAGGVIQSKSEGLEPGSRWWKCQSEFERPRTRSTNVFAGDGRPSSSRENEFSLSPPFFPIQALSGLDYACPHWWGWSFLCLLI